MLSAARPARRRRSRRARRRAARVVGACRYIAGLVRLATSVIRSLRRADRRLLALLAVALVETLVWSIALPPLQGPDEVSHFAYTQRIVEAREIPWVVRGEPADPGNPYSTEVGVATLWAGISPLWANPSARPAGTDVDERIWHERDAALGEDAKSDGGFTPALKNPPLYYLYAALPYAATYPATVFDRELAVRLANVVPLLAIVLFTWLMAGVLLGGRRWLQTLATAAVAVEPQLIHLSAVVNPDVFLAALWTAALYLMILLVRDGPARGRLALLLALCLASGFTHGRGIALVVPAAAAVALAFRRHRRPGWPRAGALALAAAGLAVAGGGLALLLYATRGDLSPSGVRQLGSYLWQFYLPKLSFMDPALRSDWGVRQVFVERFYGGFAQLEVNFSPGLIATLESASQAVALLALAGIAASWQQLRRWWDIALVLALAPVAMLALLHAKAYSSLVGGSSDPILTGRYLLPLIALYGLGIALAVSWLPRQLAQAVGAALLGGLVLLQLGALGILVERFYA